jgi:hypothetical protein
VSEDPLPTRTSWQRAYSLATTFVAPASFLSALLFYFGYVSSRAQYRYFGLDVDTIGLSTRDFVMRSPQALLVPLVLLTLLVGGLVVLSRFLDRRTLPEESTRGAYALAGLLVGVGVVLLLAYRWVGGWWAYGMATPLLLVVGLLTLGWLWHHSQVGRGAVAFALLGAAICVFWATATLAEWTGSGAAHRTARHLDQLPAVVLDTKESLYPTDGIVQETVLPPGDGQEFLFRYRGLRLLIQSGDRMFLVPDTWSKSDSTLLVPLDDVRVRFRFVNQAP